MNEKRKISAYGFLLKIWAKVQRIPAKIYKKIASPTPLPRYYYYEELLFPYPHNSTEKYCFACGGNEDASMINRLSRIYRGLEIYVLPLGGGGGSERGVKLIAPNDLEEMNICTIVIPTPFNESVIEKEVRSISQKLNIMLTLWDPYSYYMASKIIFGFKEVELGFAKRVYRNVSLFASEGNIVLPAYYANWGYINYLIDQEIRPGMSVLDMWAGSGCIGFSLKKECPDISLVLADINYFAVLSMEKTIENDSSLSGTKVFLSNVFSGLDDSSERFDLIVGNPPCGRGFASNFIQIGGADDEWKSHLAFFGNADNFLKPDGTICIVEQICEVKSNTCQYAKDFYESFNKLFPQFTVTKMIPLRGSFLSIMVIKRSTTVCKGV